MKEINAKLVVVEKDYNGNKYYVYKLYIGNEWFMVKPSDNTSKEVLEGILNK